MLLLVLLHLLLLPRQWWSCSEEGDEKMRNICRIMNKKDVGSLGIDAMIIFIAIILVAGVAATVFIKSAGQFELQSMKTAYDTMREVSSGLEVVKIEGMTNDSNITRGLSKFLIIVQIRPGAGSIDLNNTFILLSNEDVKALLRYNSSVFNGSVSGDIFSSITWGGLDGEHFGIIVLQDEDKSLSKNSNSPTLNRGDKAALVVYCNVSATFNSSIKTRTDVSGQIKPESGSPAVISFTTPMSYPKAKSIFDLQ